MSVFARSLSDANYTSECFLDGVPLLDANSPQWLLGHGRPICAATALNASTIHTISVFVSVWPQENIGLITGFAFDYMLIQPVSAESVWDGGNDDLFLTMLGMSLIQNITIPVSSSAIGIGGDQLGSITDTWIYDSSYGFHTTTAGSQFNLTFTGASLGLFLRKEKRNLRFFCIGASLWWYDYVNSSVTYGQGAIATYSIDGGDGNPFGSPGMLAPTTPVLSYSFRTPALQNVEHNLTVRHRGAQPLGLQTLVVQRSPPAGLIASTTTKKSPSPTSIPIPTSTHSNPGRLPGTIVGGVIFLLLITGALYASLIWRAWRKRRCGRMDAQDAVMAPMPFIISTEASTSGQVPSKAQTIQNHNNPFMRPLQESSSAELSRRNNFTLGVMVSSDSHSPPTASMQSFTHPQSVAACLNMLGYTSVTNIGSEDGHREQDSGLRMIPQSDGLSNGPVLPPYYTSL